MWRVAIVLAVLLFGCNRHKGLLYEECHDDGTCDLPTMECRAVISNDLYAPNPYRCMLKPAGLR